MSQEITSADVQVLANKWFTILMNHGNVEDFLPLFAFDDPDFQMQLSTMKILNFQDFKVWYKQYTDTFFDSVHSLANILSISPSNAGANVKAIEHWEASMWKPPHPKSARMILDATHNWLIVRSKKTDQPVFKTYIPVEFEFSEGSAKPPIPSSTTNNNPTINKITSFIFLWYSWFDSLSDGSEILNHLSSSNLVMELRNQNTTIRSHDDFKAWWRNVRNTLATNQHNISNIQIIQNQDQSIGVKLNAHFHGVLNNQQVIDSKFDVTWRMISSNDDFIITYYLVEPSKF